MKSLTTYINEKMIYTKSNTSKYKYHPETTKELQELIEQLIDERGIRANLNDIDTSKITSMNNLFKNINGFVGDISEWDVSNVESAESMFYDCPNFDFTQIENWNVSSLKYASFMFEECTNFNADLSNWNVENLIEAYAMFMYCDIFEGKGLDKWNIKSLTNTAKMFERCINFKGNYISDWNVSKIEIIDQMFNGCLKFNIDLSKWKFSNKVDSFSGLFTDCKDFEGKGLDKWDVHNIKYFDEMFCNCNNLSCNLEKWDISNVKTMQDMFKGVDKKIIPFWY